MQPSFVWLLFALMYLAPYNMSIFHKVLVALLPIHFRCFSVFIWMLVVLKYEYARDRYNATLHFVVRLFIFSNYFLMLYRVQMLCLVSFLKFVHLNNLLGAFMLAMRYSKVMIHSN
jgi:hypothetical protein